MTHTSPWDRDARPRAASTTRGVISEWSTATRIFSYMGLSPLDTRNSRHSRLVGTGPKVPVLRRLAASRAGIAGNEPGGDRRKRVGEGDHPASRGSRLRGVRARWPAAPRLFRGPPRHLQHGTPGGGGQGTNVRHRRDVRGGPDTRAGGGEELRRQSRDLRPYGRRGAVRRTGGMFA